MIKVEIWESEAEDVYVLRRSCATDKNVKRR